MRILLTGVGGPAGSSLARQLSQRGHWVAGVDLRTIEDHALDEFATVPAATDPIYVPTLRDFAVAWEVDAVIPSVSEELVLLAGIPEAFAVPLMIGPSDAVTIANDKYLTARRLAESGVPVPEFARAEEFGSASDAVVAFGEAIVVKPRVSRGGRGVRVITAEDAAAIDHAASWATIAGHSIVQEFAPGSEYAPVVFRSALGEVGDVCVVLEKLALKEGIVGNALSVARAEDGADANAAAVREVAIAVPDALGLTGPADIDIRFTSAGEPVVLEVNARFGANSAHAPELLDAVLTELELTRDAARSSAAA